MLRGASGDRVLPLDSKAVRKFADTSKNHRSIGRPVAPPDCQIATIARSLNVTLATRNVTDLEDINVEVVNAWKSM